MQQNTSDPDDVVKTFSNLKVSEDTALKEIPSDSPRIRSPASPQTCPDGTPKKRMGSEGSPEQTDVKQAQVRFNKLVKKAKHLAQEGKVQQALELNREALKIHHHEKLARRIAKMEEYLQNYGDRDEEEEEEEETEGGMIQLGSNSGFYLHKDLNAKLYSHQKQGVLWMWDLHRKKKGGILGDDMGLGKTIQVIAFLSGLFDLDKVRTVMIILPVSVMVNWEKEFNKWAPGIAVYPFHGTSKRERERNLARVQRRGGVLLTTYGMVLTSSEQMSQHDGRGFVWDYVVLDEGHKIKNPSKTTKAVYAVTAKHRLILTGTPIQNNLKELWTLFDYVHQGSLLGTLRTFKMEFENPIIRARERDASAAEKRLGLEMASSLKNIIDPFFMRRTKAEVKEEEKKDSGKSQQKSVKMPTMSFKNDFVVWLYLSDTQLTIYRDFLELASVKELLMSSKSPLVALTVLKKICDHPRLLSLRACHQLGLHGQEMVSDELEMPSSLESAVTKIDSMDDSVLLQEAGKMGVVVSLVNRLQEEGHRALIFSQSRKILDIIQKVLKNKGHKVVRLDGTVRGVMERDELVQKFQNNSSYSVFLLTTQVGGVGLTLTAADRVIIYDPSWNPATDAQAVDRAFRIGQTKNVVIYRLITCGTVEEKIYRRQIFKDSITRQTTGNTKDPYRYFTKQELRELFQLGDHRFSNTQKQLEDMHGTDRRRDPELDDHIAFLHSLDIFGISDHDLMFSQESPAHEIEEDVIPNENTAPANAQHDNYIKFRVQKAKDIIKQESSVPGTMEQRMKSGFQMATSVYNLPENQALMRGEVPVFQPKAADNARFMPNRPTGPGGGVNVFQPRPQDTTRTMLNRPVGSGGAGGKPPQTIIVYPPKPIKPQGEARPSSTHSSSSGSSVSEPIDLTLDGEGNDTAPSVTGRTPPLTGQRLSDSGQEESKAAECDEEPLVNLPRVEKRKKGEHRSRSGEGDSAGQPQATSQSSSEKSPSPSPATPASPQRSETKPDPKASFTTPPPTKGRPEHVVQEELFISPNAYTPLMMMRQKRRRVVGGGSEGEEHSPGVDDLSKALSATILVEESPETATPGRRRGAGTGSSGRGSSSAGEEREPSGDETPNEIASFLAEGEEEEDLDIIQDSLVEDYADNTKAHSPAAQSSSEEGGRQGGMEHSSSSSDNSNNANEEGEQEVRSKRRRSVCRRVAVIESSEDELEDEENKENLHPSFSSNASRQQQEEEEESLRREEDMDEEEEECEQQVEGGEGGGEEEGQVEEEEGEDEGEMENVEEGSCSDAEEKDGKQQPRRSIEIYDDSMAENRGEEDEQDEQEEEEEEEEKEVDVELLKELLRDGKQLYRQKQYPEALKKCQAALAMVYDPQLQAMIDKIQSKIDQGL